MFLIYLIRNTFIYCYFKRIFYEKINCLLVFITLINSAYADSFKCYRIVDGEYTGGHITVQANSKDEAHIVAMNEYKNMGYRVDSVKCD